MDIRFILFENSDTQRVTAKVDGGCVLISKEWRKSSNDEWTIGKGITCPINHLINLGKILDCHNEQELQDLLSGYEVLQEDKHDSTNGQASHSRD